ncbi:MAG: 4-alpha-glucanotransferase [Nitrospirota bacterium]|nr:4-alpha-glucanotransferase [Nitrospirota bacterium]
MTKARDAKASKTSPADNPVYNALWARRSAGVLVPLFSIRSERSLGIGDTGDLYRLVDWAAATHQGVIQLLPINDTSPHDVSPYSALSAYAANILYIDVLSVDDVAQSEEAQALLKEWEDDGTLDSLRHSRSVDYTAVRAVKLGLLGRGFKWFMKHEWESSSLRRNRFEAYMAANHWWLDDYAIFMTLKEHFHWQDWREWPEGLRNREPEVMDELLQASAERILFFKYLQWTLAVQWRKARNYAHERSVYLMGDVAFYVCTDSVDVWASRHLFGLDEDLRPAATSGAPPDAFSADGQDWGTPLYNWEAMEADGYEWWRQRVRQLGHYFDMYRLDHFRGFDEYWRIPSGKKGSEGEWMEGPGDKLLQRVLEVSLYERLIVPVVEDLGYITESVHALRHRLGLAGYKTFIFGWGDGEASGIASGFRYPEKYTEDFLATTGTHDTGTLRQWWEDLPHYEREALLHYLGIPFPEGQWDLGGLFDQVQSAVLERLFQSPARYLVLPLQDIFGLGREHRVNLPGTFSEHNWSWRTPFTLEEMLAGNRPEIDDANKMVRDMVNASDRNLAQAGEPGGLFKLCGTLPVMGTLMEEIRRPGDKFNVWVAVQGETRHVSLITDAPESTKEEGGRHLVHMRLEEILADGTKLYRIDIPATWPGRYYMGFNIDGTEIVSQEFKPLVVR